ncbi:hypothetical protein [Streptomyces hydrogenans]|uniref:Uncharacterized protein n=1 Tax=Streptomyces hydrogenans TaxID=1873719 RepID=A0ABQ3PJK0_9ACTN|nr:hypothetical protein [Streptomyces hydrogenans]GHG10101.1 hypothetical protein GCM10018784_23480 [Streptomyces hydrogenans]GHI25200.1 hypothetical protein Shyd_65710 [Streptomyces hydrogenans]
MTAREELITALHNGWACYGVENEPGAFRRLATEMVDAHAHELAEQIRAHPFHPGAEPYDGADLIDPEVS